MSQIGIEIGEPATWLSDFNGVLQNDQCDHTLPYYIWKVPDHFRLNHEHFEARTWRFGLHNRPIIHAGVADEIKMSLVGGLQLSKDEWVEFCAAVIPDPEKVQLIYGKCDPAVQSLKVEDIRKLLTLDALFLVAFLLHVGCTQPKPENPEKTIPGFCSVLKTHFFAAYETPVWFDVCLVENQIPLELLSNVISWLREKSTKDDCKNIPLWSDKFWRCTIYRLSTKHFVNRNQRDSEKSWDEQFKKSEEDFTKIDKLGRSDGMGTYEHILDIVSHNLNGHFLSSELTTDVFKRIPSATTLLKSGVTFKANSSSALGNFSFHSGCLKIPYHHLYDATEQRFRNLVLYEVLKNDRQSTMRSYTLLMGDLIRTEEDERILVDAGVIGNGLDNRSNAHKMWKEIHRNVEPPRITKALSETLNSINVFARRRRNSYWVEYKERHCSRPWFCLSAFAVTLVTICTGIQTYIAIIRSNGMNPHFP